MADAHDLQGAPEARDAIEQHLAYLKLSCIAEQYADLATHAAHKAWSHVDYLGTLLAGEADAADHEYDGKRYRRYTRRPDLPTAIPGRSGGPERPAAVRRRTSCWPR